MDADRYTREVRLLCPTCGGTTFEYEAGGPIELVKCVSCEREMTKDELIRENSENMSEHLQEIGREVTADVAKELKERLRRAFRGNKNIRIR